jgi:hypothetical protein
MTSNQTIEMDDDDPILQRPTGYVHHEPSIERVVRTIAMSSAEQSGIAGATQRAISDGTHYVNLTAFAADLFRRGDVMTSQRRSIDCGDDGQILEPLAQQTGICDGCSFGEAALVAWCARWVLCGAGEKPRECSFLWPYLAGRDLTVVSRGDTGAIPPLSAQLYHDVGVLPVNCKGRFDLSKLPPHGTNSQESLCVRMRDTPQLLQEWQETAAPYKCRIYSPRTAWDVADCITTGRPVTFGCSYQARETQPGSNGISSLYSLGGHETFGSGWFTLHGKLGFIKTESWWNAFYPGSCWPDHRVVIQTDDGPRKLYPGQAALWADEWMRCQPECWALDAPGTR